MTALRFHGFKTFLALCVLACAFGAVQAADIAGVRFDDAVKVAGKDLRLNGAGVRTKFALFKVYAAGLYLPERSASVADIMKMEGPRRVTLVMLRNVGSEEFGKAFIEGLNANSTEEQRKAIVGQTRQFGELFGLLPGLKKGDVLHLDYLPDSGTVTMVNGKQLGAPIAGRAFYDALLRIWLGDKPVDDSLKAGLLGGR